MPLTRRRWFILALAAFVNLFAGSIYAWSVFAAPLAEHLTRLTGTVLTAGDLAVVFSLANAVGPIPMLVGGWVTDRFGPRFVMITGGLLMSVGYWMTGAAQSLSAVLAGYGLFFGIGLGLVYGCTVNNTVKFFPDHRGLAGGRARYRNMGRRGYPETSRCCDGYCRHHRRSFLRPVSGKLCSGQLDADKEPPPRRA